MLRSSLAPTSPLSVTLLLAACSAPGAGSREPIEAASPAPDYARRLFAKTPASASAPESAPRENAPPPDETGTATWRLEKDESGPVWVRSHGARAADLVLRGTTSPSNPDYMGQYFAPGARLFETIRLKTEGPVRALRVFARARSPMGMVADGIAAEPMESDGMGVDLTRHTAQLPGGSAELRDGVEGEIVVRLADLDRPNERRGQTAPYVLVVTEDLAAPRAETAAPRPSPASDAVTIRWDLAPTPCAQQGNGWHCYRAAAIVGGSRIALRRVLEGQADCLPDGAGVLCEGASGGTSYDFRVDPSGRVSLESHAYSDGACDVEGTDCGTHAVLSTFRIAKGKHLVPDPAGTFAPLPASAFLPETTP